MRQAYLGKDLRQAKNIVATNIRDSIIGV